MRAIPVILVVGALVACGGGAGAGAEVTGGEPAWRYRAALEVQQAAAFVQAPLPASVYAHAEHPLLHDLRVFDAGGRRVPFALLAPRPREAREVEHRRDAALYPLPPRPPQGRPWPSPVEVHVQGERITVRRGGQPGEASAASPTPPGWLIDLGDAKARRSGEPAPTAVQLAWLPARDFSVGYSTESSADLRQWHRGGTGQLMSLTGATGTMTQATVALAPETRRFVRLVWSDPAAAPRLAGAQAVAVESRRIALDAPTPLQYTPGAAPGGGRGDGDDARALHFDFGGPLPIERLELALPAGATRVAPVRIDGRERPDTPWRPLAHAVFYRIERDAPPVAEPAVSPPLDLDVRVRQLRVVTDERAAPLEAAGTRLVVHAALPRLVFAAQGPSPFELRAGLARATPGALPVATLVPALDDERERFGRASVGEWQEVEAAARQARDAQRRAAWRPWLLWSVLLAGVAALGWMVWRLGRGRGR